MNSDEPGMKTKREVALLETHQVRNCKRSTSFNVKQLAALTNKGVGVRGVRTIPIVHHIRVW